MPDPTDTPLLQKVRPWLWTALAIYWVSLVVGTHLPLKQSTLPGQSDKLIHFVAYFGLAVLWGLCIASHRRMTRSCYLGIFLLLTVSGYLDELTQPLVNRHYSLWDWLADVVGVVLGLLFVWLILPLLDRKTEAN